MNAIDSPLAIAMSRIVLLSCLLLSLLGVAGSALAQGRWRDLPPAERQELRRQMREHWQQDAQYRQQGDAPRWRDLQPDDRQRLRQEMREQRGWSNDQGPRRGRGE